MTRLVLWDIDHTLIDTRGVGRELSASAFARTTGRPMHEQAKIDGITEAVIFRETARLHGITTDRSDFKRFARALTHEHLKRLAELRERGHALPGAAAALAALAADGVRQTVVSGNIRAVAQIKLQVFGLDTRILWDLGAFGEDDDVRAELVRLSLQRANTTADNAVLIGDTPADIAGAHANGVRVIAVASGRSDEATLRSAGAETVLSDLRDTELLVKLVHASA
ncbi:haloacid dehalogenase-like hydrolase [Streptomyces sp. NBC_00201]|uniref:HAD family hydrolase n=1 Tax=unclassified Streptomyces TaxID=2593676 RepID=UPI00224DE6A5|nr:MULTISPECIES: haloacid dehalogenase-like hydrolase [unclassified Streptomyces]MCX5063718.1 haloacid dehalogenase-like hydrolase [Streptomyces sp. NBC_00452]MCX5251873.1 haloacid dehalogenase-like hydrolase [Streptomyces sp. NBC_00201]MCX5294224.1 haloacid dehalogenase-like hydrolase [Streptomyces sp. NBC_00183]